MKTIEERFTSPKHDNPRKLRDDRARQLRKEGWTVKCSKVSFMDLARGEMYKLTATRPDEPTRRYFEEGAEIGSQIIEETGWYVFIGGAWYWDEQSQESEVKP